MHEHEKNTRPRRARRGLILSVGCAALFALCALWLTRAQTLVRPAVDARFAAWETRIGGALAYDGLRVSGLRAVMLTDVTWTPAGSDEATIRIDALEITLELRSLASGRPAVSDVALSGLTAQADLRALTSREGPYWQAYRSMRASRGEGTGLRATGRRLPSVEIGDAVVYVLDSERSTMWTVALEELRFIPSRSRGTRTYEVGARGEALEVARFSLDGRIGGGRPGRLELRVDEWLGDHPALPDHVYTPSGTLLSVGALMLDRAGEVALRPVGLTGVDIPVAPALGWHVESMWFGDLNLWERDAGFGVRLRDAQIDLRGVEDRTTLRLAECELHGGGAEVSRAVTARVIDGLGGESQVSLTLNEGGQVAFSSTMVAMDARAYLALLPRDLMVRPYAGVVSGDVTMSRHASGDPWTGRVEVEVSQGGLDAPPLASRALSAIDARLRADVVLAHDQSGLWLPTLRVAVGEAWLDAQLRVEWRPRARRVEVVARMPDTRAQFLLDALPIGLAPTLEGYRVGGRLGVSLSLLALVDDPDRSRLEVAFVDDGLRVEAFGPSAPIDRLNDEDFAWTVRAFDGSTRRIGPGTSSWVSGERVSESLFRAVVAAEDDRFWRHAGFDARGIERAMQVNLGRRRFVQGGSTITQQVVKNLFLTHERTLSRKVQEGVLTWILERHISKRRILEYYVNLAHWGPDVYGISEASLAYFNHVPRRLTLRESVFLAAILPNPSLYGEQYARGIVPPSRRQKMRNILWNLHRAGFIDEDELSAHVASVERGVVSASPLPSELGAVRPVTASADVAESVRAFPLFEW